MESNNLNQISINIPNYNGPLEVLLELAKSQKVDLAEISITKLADQFLEFIKNSKSLDLESARIFTRSMVGLLINSHRGWRWRF